MRRRNSDTESQDRNTGRWTLRKAIFWTHLAAGVSAGLVIVLMSVTGTLLMYERQLIEWSDRDLRSQPPAPGAERASVETLLAALDAREPGETATAVTLRADPLAPASVTLGDKTVLVDAYTGEVLGEPSTGVRALMSELRAWHRWVGMAGENRPLGKAVSGWANVIFFFIVMSGMYLWLPRRWSWQTVRGVVLFRGGLRGKARDFNWHNVIGIWSAVPLAIVVATAMPISFPWANALVYRIVGEEVPAAAPREARPATDRRSEEPGTSSIGLNGLWERAERQVPDWRSINLRLPASAEAPAVFAIDSGNGGQPQLRSTLTLDASTGAVVRWEDFDSLSPGRQLRSWTRFTHTGEYYGLVGQTIAGVVSAGGAVLVWTGLALAWRRFRRRSASTPAAFRNARADGSRAA